MRGMAERTKTSLPPLAVAALGVVFGDIGTSPLYAFRQCFHSGLSLAPTRENVLGVVSLILWSLVVIVFVRYIAMVMRVAHDGEGGILALLALVLPPWKRGIPPQATWLTFLILVGAGMLFGDGVITPAVSVLSSVEGLSVATSAAQHFVVPITVGVLAALFFVQNRGTSRIGAFFGPVMIALFLTIAVLGAMGIVKYPAVFLAVNPTYVVVFFAHHGFGAIAVFGAVVLCVSGVEALYADMSHFGRTPIAIAWTVLVFPALALNYFGQAALVLADPSRIDNPFFQLVPRFALYGVVAVATAATIIASQALISGAFTLAKQAIQLGFIPRLRVVHTSADHRGQIYVPVLNALLAVVCICLVLGFRSSERLANAYGLAVAVTMVVTSIAYYVVVRRKFAWPQTMSIVCTAPFLIVELLFVTGSLPKIAEGGWIPLAISGIVFLIASTWRTGRRRIAQTYVDQSVPVEQFLADFPSLPETRLAGTAVFLTGDPEGIPFILRHHWARTHCIDERIVLLTIVPSTDPYIAGGDKGTVERLAANLIRVKASFGFMEKFDITPIVRACADEGLELDGEDTTYYSVDPQLVPKKHGAWRAWRRTFFDILRRNSRPITTSLGIPADQLAKLGLEVPM